MSEAALTVQACTGCGHVRWPPRPVCPRCGATGFDARPARHGVVEESTRVGDVGLASVRLDAGPVVIARLVYDAPSGAPVELRWVDGRAVAAPRD
ncbi:MAG TPA: zinc ribbon domain-containing protein [Solirubrobacteraceae bacterium]|jgi:hypothetical protein|nr:zinc ribbon domain-containing protein [Solirubrobacteraceae bacterium]